MNMLHTSLYLGEKVWRIDSYVLQVDLLCDVVIHAGLGSAGWWTYRMVATKSTASINQNSMKICCHLLNNYSHNPTRNKLCVDSRIVLILALKLSSQQNKKKHINITSWVT